MSTQPFTIESLIASAPAEPEKIPPPRQDTFALVIGIDYKNRTDIPHLKYPSQDAQKIYETLTDPRYGGVPKENTILLLNNEATRNKIITSLGKIKNQDGYIYVYFSGHGAPKIEGKNITDAFLIPNDVIRSSPYEMENTSISLSYIHELIDQSSAKGIMVALDACFTGSGKSIVPEGGKPLVGMPAPRTFIEPSGTGKVVITSSATDQQSWEDDTIKSGIFSHYLLEGLKGKSSKGVWITVNEISDYIEDNVPKAAKKLKGEEQIPQVSGKGYFAVARNWTKIKEIENAETKLKNGFGKGLITLEQLNRASEELKNPNRSKPLEAFIKGEIDEREFGKVY
ncbi:MAG: caspase family protein [Nitrospinae bacterium]|nr:caspase family protein [Nitrospinota bacterium]